MTWHVWTDGSCQHGEQGATPGRAGAGGWCAIVEHQSEGEVHRGRDPKTTNVRMELVAATRGLRAVPANARVVLHTDCTTVLCVLDAVERGVLRRHRGPDRAYWLALAREIRARRVRIDLLVRGTVHPIHRRAHGFAGAEARAQLAGLPANVVPLDRRRTDEKARRRALKRAADARFGGGPWDYSGESA